MASKTWPRLIPSLSCAAALLAFQLPASQPAYAKVWKIALSNSYIGNEWRVEMINMLKAYVRDNYKGKVDLIVNSSGPDVQKQIAAIDDMISQKVDAILINPVSATALNSVIAEATKQGIVVVDFDQNVTSSAPYKVTADFIAMGEAHATVHRRRARRQGQCHHQPWRRRVRGRFEHVQGEHECLQEIPQHSCRRRSLRKMGRRRLPGGVDQGADRPSRRAGHHQPGWRVWGAAGADQSQTPAERRHDRRGQQRLANCDAEIQGPGAEGPVARRAADEQRARAQGRRWRPSRARSHRRTSACRCRT